MECGIVIDHFYFNDGQGYGNSKFLPIASLEDKDSGFLVDDWVTLIVYVTEVDDKVARIYGESSRRNNILEEESAICILCRAKKTTSGILHGKT